MLNIANRSHTTANGKNSQKPWKLIIIDSFIIAGVAFFASLPPGMPTQETLYIALKALGLAFFTQLVIERGLKRE